MKFMDWAQDMINTLQKEPESYQSWFEDLLDLLVRELDYPGAVDDMTYSFHVVSRNRNSFQRSGASSTLMTWMLGLNTYANS